MSNRDLESALRDPGRLSALEATGLLDSGPEESFDRLGRVAQRLVGAPVALVSLVDSSRQHFKCCLGLKLPWGDPETPLTHSICQHALVSDGPLIVSDVTTDPRLVGNLAPELGAIAYLGIPLVSKDGHVLGSFCAIDDHPRDWTAGEVLLMVDLAGSVMAEIELREAMTQLADGQAEAARLAAAETSARMRAEQMFDFARALTGASGLEDILQRTTGIGGALVGAVFANIALVDAQTGEVSLLHGAGLDDDIRQQWLRTTLDDSTPIGRALVTGAPVHLADSSEIRSRFPTGAQDAATAGFCALAAYPVRSGVAAMGFAWDHPMVFTLELRASLTTVVQLVGLGLDRAQNTDRDRRIAEQLQCSMLPSHLVPIPDASVAGLYKAGASGMRVGGDWYDVASIGDGRFVLAVGDVVGHGLQAAVAMGQMRTAFAALAPIEGLDELVDRLSNFAAGIAAARLSTLVLAEYRASDGTLRVVSAGHVPPVVRRSTGSVEQLPDAGPPLGLPVAGRRTTIQLSLDVGDTLVMYSDGLVERRGESIDVGLSRLHAALSSAQSVSAAALVNELYDSLGRPHADDVGILALVR